MKLEQKDLEIMALAHFTRYPKALDKAQQRRVDSEHFIFKDEGSSRSITQALYNLSRGYWRDSGGSLFTEFVLEAKLIENNVSDKLRAKFMTMWAEIEDTETDEDELHEILTQLKNRHCMRLVNDMFAKGHETLTDSDGGGLDATLLVVKEYLDQIQEQINEIGGDIERFDVSESADHFLKEYEKRVQHPELYRGIPCGLPEIDDKTFGFLPGQIIVFLAPSSGGKSVMMLNAAMTAHHIAKKNVLYFSFEMNSWLCLLRHLSLMFDVPYSQLKDVTASPEVLQKIVNKLAAMKDGPYFEYDVNMEDPTPEYIDSRVRELIATKGKPDLLVVDYIGNMTVRKPPQNAKDHEVQSMAVTQLFMMAKRYQIPIITAQQINRETIKDARKMKENNKFMTYDQAAASGGQKLLHLCTYAIAQEPDRENNVIVFHPVKMRDAYFHSFPANIHPDFNKIVPMTDAEKDEYMLRRQMTTGKASRPGNSAADRPVNGPIPDQGEEWTSPETNTEEEELDLGNWSLMN